MQTVNPEQYKSKVSGTEMVQLKSGNVFEVKKHVNSRKLAAYALPLVNDLSKTNVEKNKIRWQKMSDKEKSEAMKINDAMIMLAVKSPEMSMEEEKGKLCVEDLTDEDYYELLGKINKISYGGDIESPLSVTDSPSE